MKVEEHNTTPLLTNTTKYEEDEKRKLNPAFPICKYDNKNLKSSLLRILRELCDYNIIHHIN